GNTDEYYRILLKLRRLLNTSDGSIPSIIKAIKFFYSSEIVHIVPDYPAGLIIEHDGEGTPGLNFNKLLAEIIPAGVSFSTKELFDFLEELVSADNQLVQVHHIPKEEFEGRIYHNRRILRDSRTILTTELKGAFHNGVNYHNGFTKHNSQYESESTSYIRFPLTRESGYRDPLELKYGLPMRDFQFSQLFHNGTITYRVRAKHNAEFFHNSVINRMPIARHNGRSTYSISDVISIFTLRQPAAEIFPAKEKFLVNVTAYDSDLFRKPYFHDGKRKHNSVIFHSGWVLDFLSLVQGFSLKDIAAGSIYHNGTLRHNGGEKHCGLGNHYAYEKQSLNIGFRFNETIPAAENHVLRMENNTKELVSKFYKHNRSQTHNGTTLYTSLLGDKMTMRTEVSPFKDTTGGILRHNNSITHNGVEKHSFTGTQLAYDTLAIGFRYHHFHDGVYSRNNGIRHNAGVFIPL
ncbi:MAG: DUF2612 domain-containing protein, partial [Bacteroidales bacterium]|nr:DUF2612 domain-containing protein [Bacteroidales bacterium]